MRARSLVYGCLLAVIFTAPQAIADQWQGSYSYPDNRSPVPFTLQLSGSQGAISGRTSEPNTFGKPPGGQLYANVRGVINGSSISFIKTYDGSHGVNHSVEYRGTIAGRNMSGTWRIGNNSGGFSAVLVGQASACDDCEANYKDCLSTAFDVTETTTCTIMLNICRKSCN